MNKSDDNNVLDSPKQELLDLVNSQFKDMKHGRFQPPEFRGMVSLNKYVTPNSTLEDLIADDSMVR